MKKLLVIFVAITMVLSLAACGGNKSADGETTHLTVEIFDRGNMPESYGDPTNNFWANYIHDTVLEKFNIDVEFISIPRSEETNKITALIASGDEPDIFYTYEYNYMCQLAEQGALADLSEPLNNYGKDIIEYLGDEVLPYGQYKGVQYSVNGRRSGTSMLCSYIRKDWLDALNIEVKERNGVASMTPSELYSAMTKIKEAGYCKYPFAVLKEWQSIMPIEGAFLDADDCDATTISKLCNFKYMLSACSDMGVKEAYKFMNKCYNDGLINPDFPLYKYEDIGEWVASNQCAFWTGTTWQFMGANENLASLYSSNPEAEVIAIEICNEDGGRAYYKQYAPVGSWVMVSSECENVDAAVTYLNWMMSDEAHMMLAHGVEGEHWKYDEDGLISVIDTKHNNDTRISVEDLYLFGVTDPCEKFNSHTAVTEIEKKLENLNIAAKDIGGTDKWHNKYIGGLKMPGKYTLEVTENLERLVVSSIMAEDGSFDSVYDSNYEKFLKEGGQQIIDEALEAEK